MKLILVIEDEQAIRSNMLKLLTLSGFQAIGAENGRMGVQMAQVYLPDLVLCDIMMPDLDGYEVLNTLRQQPETAMIPFIFLSAKAERSDLRYGMNLGADDYVTKPFTSRELLEAIKARLAKQETVTQPYVDEMKRAAESLSTVAYCDPLTSLPNRIVLRHRIQEAIVQAQRSSQLVAVICLNIDRFNEINATLGYSMGDLVLQAVAQRLSQCVSPQDTVARLGGDEFSIVLVRVPDREAVTELMSTILGALRAPYLINGEIIALRVSVGIALYPEHGANPDQLLSRAETSIRWGRKQGEKEFQFYQPSMDLIDAERRLLETDLRSALDNNEFLLYYQPQVNLITGRMVGMEALVRWQHPQRGLLPPNRFIHLAEDLDLVIPLGAWVLKQACLQAQAWQSISLVPLRMSVNLSARQFKQANLAACVAQTLQETGLNPKLLVMEVTETSLMEDIDDTVEKLRDLKAIGMEISIDDFGTGYSSLNYLRRFPLDTLKIDRSFVAQVMSDSNDAAIATAIIAMAQSLKLKVIAEGVETEDQLAFLRKHGCYAMQGFLFSPALPAAEIEALLKQDKRLNALTANS
ncbi:MAG: EAL domain-containing protein [Desertifilum sp.]|nr:EAL domain-containing protein [Desertifilum sp.]